MYNSNDTELSDITYFHDYFEITAFCLTIFNLYVLFTSQTVAYLSSNFKQTGACTTQTSNYTTQTSAYTTQTSAYTTQTRTCTTLATLPCANTTQTSDEPTQTSAYKSQTSAYITQTNTCTRQTRPTQNKQEYVYTTQKRAYTTQKTHN